MREVLDQHRADQGKYPSSLGALIAAGYLRALPKDPDPRWYGYSTGKWTDDYTFVVNTVGMDDRTWLDNAGRPHSEELVVTEEFHRVDHDNLQLSMTLDDPKVYTKPWVALNKLPFKLLPATFETPEMMCSPSELEAYNAKHARQHGCIIPMSSPSRTSAYRRRTS